MASEEAADWRVGLTFHQRLSYMFDEKYAFDVTFLVGRGEKQETVCCHRFPLIAGSAVLEHLLENKIDQEIVVPDIEPTGFKTLMKYLYNGELNILASNVMALMHAANKYDIKEVTEQCGKFLKAQINGGNVCTILETSMQYDETSLTEKCLEFVSENAVDILASKNFADLSNKALMKVVERDVLLINSEVIVYKACMRWADAECERKQLEVTDGNRRSVLGDVLFKIRFPAMGQAEFAEISRYSELLTDNEKSKIYDHIILDGKKGGKCQCKFNFNKKGRCVTAVTVSRFSSSNVYDGWPTLTSYDAVSAVDFQCNKTCMIEAVSIFGGKDACDRTVKLKLLDSAGFELSTNTIAINTSGTKIPNRVKFRQPLLIHGGKLYSVVASIEGQNYTYYGDKGSLSVEDEDFVVTLHNSPHGRYKSKRNQYYSSADRGQIPELYFLKV